MALLALEGVYRNGMVELPEYPREMEGAKVFVTFVMTAEMAEAEKERKRQAGEDLIKSLREAARDRFFARMDAGINFGGEKFDRNEIYEDRMNELDARRGR